MEEGRAQLRAGEDLPCPPTLRALQKLLLSLSVAPSFYLLPPFPPSPPSFPPSSSYFSTAISEPSQGLPQFFAVGYLDDQLFSYYDSNSQKVQPRYWDRETQISRGTEEWFRENLETLRNRDNQSEGLHTWQRMLGCELWRDGSKGGVWQYGYDGRTFLTFDKQTLTWVAPDPQSQITKSQWDALPAQNQYIKSYLEQECIDWIRKYLPYGNETLLRTGEHLDPGWTFLLYGRISRTHSTHVCHLDGFYPREINASWMRDGEVWLKDTFRGSLAPNADGTYHSWLSIRINPKERGHYWCHVEHDSLQEPLDLALEGERLQGGTGWALWQAGRWWERNPAPDVSRCEHT
uniref:Ig-like domain-containing protein n=1 Tax=Naja naja TaxID=35670 RepID=A0A8C6XVN3_NAJNA